GAAPQLQVLFTLQSNAGAAAVLDGLSNEGVRVHVGASKFELSLEAITSPAGLHLRAEYRTDLFEPDTIAGYLEQFETLLGHVIANPAMKVSDVPLLDEAARNAVLDLGGRRRAKIYTVNTTLADAFIR